MITSLSNPQIKQIVQLNTKAKARREAGLFVAEGYRIFREIPEKLLEKVFVSLSFSEEHEEILKDIDFEVVDDKLFAKICDTKTPQGILALVHMPSYTLEDILSSVQTPLLLLLEDLQDPGNVGTILRTAEGAGVTGMILTRNSVDLFSPKTIRSTMGAVFRMPFCYTDDPEAVLEKFKEKGIHSYAAHLQGKNTYDKEDYRGGTAFLIGNEGNGLSEHLSRQSDTWIRIPMEGELESLNASVAAAILMYTVHRQRHD